jgi:hypothetical protein
MSPHELHADWLNKQKLMSETTTTTLEPTTTTRKTRTRKQSPQHITELKAAVTKALKQEWLLQKEKERLQKAIAVQTSKIGYLNAKTREAWLAVHERSADCANVHLA